MRFGEFHVPKCRDLCLALVGATSLVLTGPSLSLAGEADNQVHYMTDDERAAWQGGGGAPQSIYKVPDGVDPMYPGSGMGSSVYKIPDAADPMYPAPKIMSEPPYKIPDAVDPMYPDVMPAAQPDKMTPDAADPVKAEPVVEEPPIDLTSIDGCQAAINQAMKAEPIEFYPGKFKISSVGLKTVDDVANLLKGCESTKIIVEGHTDSSGNPLINQRLSGKRASTVAEHLEKRGIAKNRIRAVGYGESKPIAPNDTEANMAQNRRIELTLY